MNFSIIESSGKDNSTSLFKCVLYLFMLYCFWLYSLYCIKSTSLSVADYLSICLEYCLRTYFLSWETRTDSLPCDLYVFISKPYECTQIELYATFLAAFDNYVVSMNNTVQLDFQLYFIFIITTS